MSRGNMVFTYTDVNNDEHSFPVKSVVASPAGLTWTDHEGKVGMQLLLYIKHFRVDEVQG